MKGKKKFVKNSMKRGWGRILASLMALCMILSVHSVSASIVNVDSKPKSDTDTYVYVTHKHIDVEPVTDSYRIQADGTIIKNGESTALNNTLPVSPDPKESERFTAFSLLSGQNAVEIKKEADGTSVAEVSYNSNVHLVKIDVFYSSSANQVTGVEFGMDTPNYDKNLEKDVVKMTPEQYGTATGQTDIEMETDEDGQATIYNTAEGLHTNKTASVNTELSETLDGVTEEGDDADGKDPRTFDVKLESWFSGQNLMDVGMILDASGSMAFSSTGGEPIQLNLEEPKVQEALGDLKVVNGIRWLTQDQVDKILDKNYTSNSLLDYGEYKYYVYDGRKGTKEYIPLGYWDGTGLEIKDTLGEGLIGYYPLNNSLKNMAPGADGEAMVLNELGSPVEKEAEFAKDAKNKDALK